MNKILNEFLAFYLHPGVSIGIVVIILFGLILFFIFKYYSHSSFFIFFDLCFEKVYEFFEEILGNDEKKGIKIYITLLFFIILFSNLFGVVLELLLPIFGHGMDHYIKIPTADINFNIAMAIVGLVVIIFEQFKTLGFGKTLYEYFPILGKGYIPYTRGIMPKIIDLPLFLVVKLFDIIISLFLGILEIIGHGAKIISLSFRLFGNITSGGILLTMLMGALIGFTNNLIGISLPIIGPVVLYLQELLVAFIQALVFPLLIAIFIKVAKIH